MKDWKTTIIGTALAACYVLQTTLQAGNSLADWKTWIVPVLLAALGYLAKDSNTPVTP